MARSSKSRKRTGREDARPDRDRIARRHQIVGWWSLVVFASLGLILEVLHGLKIGFYLDVANQTRRLMWTLAHAHGTLIGLTHIAFVVAVGAAAAHRTGAVRVASRCLIGATIFLPTGFFAGGIQIHAGDPGIGIALVPVGAALLIAALFLTALAVTARDR